MERPIIKKRSETIGIVQNGVLLYASQGQHRTIIVGTPSWYAWLETATTFTFTCEEGSFTARKMRAGNRRGGWYWRAYRRKLGQLSTCYLGVSANATLPRLQEAARLLALRAVGQTPGKEAAEQELRSPSSASSPARTLALPLSSKFAIPRLPVPSVPRPHLLTLLEQGAQKALTLVSAPAGSGKTTLLAQWAATTPLSIAWLSLETAENDPARFLACLVASLAHLNGPRSTALQAAPPSEGADFEQILTPLLNDLQERLQKETVLILDDYHLLTADVVHTILLFLVNHLPARLHLIIGTRVDPPLPLARLRAQGHLCELAPQALRFSRAELEALVQGMGLSLSEEAIDLLQARTEGWIAGISLLIMALRSQGDAQAEAFQRAFEGQHRFLVDYVREDILVRQPAEIQHFLFRTCVLERLTGPLCDAMTGETEGAAQLLALCQAHLFVNALDDTGTWYRYHPLFAETLRALLQQQEPERLPELYRRASHWYEEQQCLEEAGDFALLAGDFSRTATLLERLVPRFIEQGRVLHLRERLSQLPPTVIAASPLLAVLSTWIQVLHKNWLFRNEQSLELFGASLDRHLQQIQGQAPSPHASETSLRDTRQLVQALLALGKQERVQGLFSLPNLLPALSQPESVLSEFIAAGQRLLLGAAERASGKLDVAEQVLLLSDQRGSPRETAPLDFIAGLNLADLYEARGQLHQLGQWYDDLLETPGKHADSAPFLLAQVQVRFAALLYEWNLLAEAESVVEQGMKQAERLELPIPGITLSGLLTRARLAWAKGEREQARQWLARPEADPNTFPIPLFAKKALTASSARLALICHVPEQAEHWLAISRYHVDDQLPLGLTNSDYFGYVTLVRLLLAQSRLHHPPQALTQAQSLLDQLRNRAVQTGCAGWLIELEMLSALTLQAQGKTKAALAQLGATLAEAEPEGYIRLFADEGEVMEQLLRHIVPYTHASSGYLQVLLAALPPSTPHKEERQRATSQVSPRELEVLQKLAAGYSNQQIAESLVISPHTVKLHVKHLLEKLVVANRTQAVTRARELHLL